MNTPAHAILNLVVLGRQPPGAPRRPYVAATLLGALLPDLPMFGFVFWHRWAVGTPWRRIWNYEYFRDEWQAFFDVFNSLPLIAVLFALGKWRRSRFVCLVAASMALHVAFDLPLHHDDGHGHFFPFTDWRFESPVSYWDRQHYGHIFWALEKAMVVAGGVLLVIRHHRLRREAPPATEFAE
ncbi:MAG: hypothetical protein ACYTGQ_13830 [Planctomycetota bacterium]